MKTISTVKRQSMRLDVKLRYVVPLRKILTQLIGYSKCTSKFTRRPTDVLKHTKSEIVITMGSMTSMTQTSSSHTVVCKISSRVTTIGKV